MVKNVVTGAMAPSQVTQILAAHGFAGHEAEALLVVSRRPAKLLWANERALTRLQAKDAAELQHILFDTAAGRAYAARLGRITAQGSYRLERLTLAGHVTPIVIATHAVEADEPLALLHVRDLGTAADVASNPVALPLQPEPGPTLGDTPPSTAPTRILWETDNAGILTHIGPNAPILEALALKVGDDLPSRLRAFAPEAAERVLAAARQQGSVAVLRIEWPQGGSEAPLAVDLGAAARRGPVPGLRGFFALYEAPRTARAEDSVVSKAEPLPPAEVLSPRTEEPEHPFVAPLPEEPDAAIVAAEASPAATPPSALPPIAPEPPGRGNVVHFPAMRLGAVPANFGTALRPIPNAEAMSLTGAEFTIPQWSEAPPLPARPEPDVETLSADERDAFEHIRKVLGTRPFANPGPSRSEAAAPPPTSLLADLPGLLDRVPVALRLEARGIAYANVAWRDRLGPEARQGDVPPAAETARFDFAGAPASLTILPAPAPDARLAPEATTEALDLATDGHLRLDETGAVTALSPKAARLLGLDIKTALGRPFTSLLGDGQSPGWQALAAVATGSAAPPQGPTPLRLRNATGQAVPVQIRLGRIDGSLLCCLTLDRQAPANDSAEAARLEAERTSALKSEFLAKVSHEIRTPLNAILGFAEVIRDERLGPVGNARYLEYLRDIHASGTHVMSLVNDLLDLSRIEAGRMDLNLAAVDANAIVQSCVNTLQTQAHAARVIVRLSLTPRLPATLADERSLRQIVLNLLSNAIKFNEPGGQVIVSTALAGPHAVAIRIRDTGVGMSEDEIATAMEPFRQLSTVNRTGSGLGLPLTKALVEANCASMSIKSARGEGTLVEITFPLVESDSMSLPAE